MADECEGLRLLEKCSKEQAEKFVHETLDGICDAKHPRYSNYGKHWTIGEWQSVQQATSNALKTFVCERLSKDEISKKLDNLNVDSDIKQVLLGCYFVRRDDIRATLVSNTTEITNAHLKDFDWKLKMVLASDKSATIRKPVVSVDLDIIQGNTNSAVTVEMTKEQLKYFVSSLEAANKVVMQLKG